MYHQFGQNDGASSCRFYFLSSAKIGNRQADSSQTDAACVRFQGPNTEVVLILDSILVLILFYFPEMRTII